MVLADAGAFIGAPFMRIAENIIMALPGIVAAILILVLGWLVGALIGHLVKKLLERSKLTSTIVSKMGLKGAVGSWDLPHLFGLLVKWYIFVVFLSPAAEVAGLGSFAGFLGDAAKWIPNIILAVVIVLGGWILSEYIASKVLEVKSKKQSMLASVAKVVTMTLVVLVALKQVGIQLDLAENVFLTVLAGVMLAFALAFGLGFKDEARDIVKSLRKKL